MWPFLLISTLFRLGEANNEFFGLIEKKQRFSNRI